MEGRGAHPFRHGLAQVLHPVGHLGLAASAQLQARPVSKDDLEGVGPVRGIGSPTATALLPPGPEEEGETERGGGKGRGPEVGTGRRCRVGLSPCNLGYPWYPGPYERLRATE